MNKYPGQDQQVMHDAVKAGSGLVLFRLGDWYVDAASNRLCRDTLEVKLESKVMAVLLYLAQHPHELVSRTALEQAVWGKTVVGYDALTGCIARLRKALDDDPRQPRYIETISKKGYRLIGEITPLHSASEEPATADPVRSPHRPRAVRLAAGLIALLVLVSGLLMLAGNQEDAPISLAEDRPSIVVLPFVNLSDEPGHDYFSDGITADITTALSKLSGLLVISQSSANDWRDIPTDLRQVAHSLDVQYVVEGSIRRSGDRLRVNVHLVDVQRNLYVWSEKYDHELRNVFDVQDDITANVINALSIKLTEVERRRTAQRYTHSITAYDHFLRGLTLYGHYSRTDNQLARGYYQQAIDLDPNFARAYSSMALTYVAEYRYGWPSASANQLDQALELARQAVSIDAELPQSYWVLAYVHVFRQDYHAAAKAAERAIVLEPNYADSYITLAVSKMYFGSPAEALQLVRKAMRLNPKYPAAYASVLGQILFFLGEYEQAVPPLREAAERNASLLTPHVVLIVALSKLGRDDEAAWAAEQVKVMAADFKSEHLNGMLPIQNAELIHDMREHLQRVGL